MCTICKERLSVFHPDFLPAHDLTVTKTYLNQVAEWETKPTEQRTKMATLHKGKCKRCMDTLVEAEKLRVEGVATFGSENMMNLLWGLPDVDKPLTPDDGLLLKELHYCFDNATIVEENLIALLHMQVCICHTRPGRRKQYNGMPCFRKKYHCVSAGIVRSETIA